MAGMTILLFPVSGPPLSHTFLVNSETHPEAARGCHGHQARVAAVESEYPAEGVGWRRVFWRQTEPGWRAGPATATQVAPCPSRVKWA